jgi:hypothetical protein
MLIPKIKIKRNCQTLPKKLKIDAQLPTKPTKPEKMSQDVFTEFPAKVIGFTKVRSMYAVSAGLSAL